jgi:small basic protein
MKRAKFFRIAATFILGMTAIFWLFKGLADLIGGVQGGVYNLIVAIALILLGVFIWKLPLLGGITTALLGVILALYFNLSLPDIYSAYIPLFLICAPMVLGGLLSIEADWASKKRD